MRQFHSFRRLPAWMATLCLLMIVASVFSACGGGRQKALLDEIRERGKLVAGIKYDSKPFGYLDANGKLQGYDIDLMRELARRILGNPDAVEFHQVLSSTRVIALNNGMVDAVAATMTITPERAKKITFSEPYYTAHQAVAVPDKSPVKSLEQLSDQTILFVMGATSEANIKKRLPKADYLGFKSSTDAFSALKAGRGSAMTTDNTILSGFLSDTCGFRMLPDRLSNEPYGIGFKKDPKTTASFVALVNKTLAEMKADGTLARMEEKWLVRESAPKQCH